MSVPGGVTLAVPGFVDFVTGGTMIVDGALTLAICYKDALTFPFSGTGSVGGIRPPIEYSCTYIPPGGSFIGAGLSASALANVPPPAPRVRLPIVVRKPVVVRLRPLR